MKQATAVKPETSNGKDDSMTGDRPQQQEWKQQQEIQ
jgi:hypothetical protein